MTKVFGRNRGGGGKGGNRDLDELERGELFGSHMELDGDNGQGVGQVS